MYWHQNVFFADQAVMLPFAAILYAEVLRDIQIDSRKRKIISIIQAIFFSYGVFTDWFMLIVCVFVYMKRIISKNITINIGFIKNTFTFWLGPLISLAIFAVQLTYSHQWRQFVQKGTTRMGINNIWYNFEEFSRKFWSYTIFSGYGALSIWMTWGCLIFFIIVSIKLLLRLFNDHDRKIASWFVSICGISLLPCLTHVYILREHSYIHDFSALKFSIPLSILPFTLVPIYMLSNRLRPENLSLGWPNKKTRTIFLIALMSFTATSLYAFQIHPQFRSFFLGSNLNSDNLEQFGNYYGYNDVLVSTDFSLPPNPPQLIAYTMKPVHYIRSQADVFRLTEPIRERYKVHYLTLHDLEAVLGGLPEWLWTFDIVKTPNPFRRHQP
ncbi:MAG: hypothetical protein ACM3ZC_05115 [Bacteroidota bacterium]